VVLNEPLEQCNKLISMGIVAVIGGQPFLVTAILLSGEAYNVPGF
jgi:hypothetical protein